VTTAAGCGGRGTSPEETRAELRRWSSAVDDICRATRDGRPRVREFLAALEKVEPRLSQMTRTTAEGSLKPIGKLGLGLADATREFQDRAEAVGLRECAHAASSSSTATSPSAGGR
jgi:hypothetical protein